jgi:hypothetical protein
LPTVLLPGVVEDKQELERQRLLNEASAPPDVPEDMQRRADEGPSREVEADAEASAPSAPVVDDYDDFPGYGSSAGPSGTSRHADGEQLPAYQR